MKNKYQKLVNQTIPISQQIGWQIESLSAEKIVAHTQLAPNINIHGTGFAGSLFAAAMATGWTLLKYWSDQQTFRSELVAAEANIKYLSPVTDDFICEATLDTTSDAYAQLLLRFAADKNARLLQDVEVRCNDNLCAILQVQFVFKPKAKNKE